MASRKLKIRLGLVGGVLLAWFLLIVLVGQLSESHRPKPSRSTAGSRPDQPLANQERAETITAYERSRVAGNLLRGIELRDHSAVLDFIDEPGQLLLTDEQGNTPLHRAVARQDPLLVRMLLAYGADPQRLNGDGRLPVQLNRPANRRTYRLSANQRDIIAAFVEHHEELPIEDPRHRAQLRFFYAVREGDMESARTALGDGADPLARQTHLQQTVLHLNRKPHLVPELVAMGVSLDATHARNRTALRTALTDGKWDLARALLDAGAIINVTDEPSDLAVVLGSRDTAASDLARRLLDDGASVGEKEWLSAMASRNVATVRLLMQREGGFDPTTDEGGERVQEAIRMGGDPILTELRRYPAIDSYLEDQDRARIEATQEAARWIQPHVVTLYWLLNAFALLSAATAMLLCGSRLVPVLVLTGVSTASMAHLFVFTRMIETGLHNARLLGEPVSQHALLYYGVVDGLALGFGLCTALLVWWLARYLPRRRIIFASGTAVHVATLVVLVLHNLGAIHWPAAVYRSQSGYDDYIAQLQQEQERKHQAIQAARRNRPRTESPQPQRPLHLQLFDAVEGNDIAAVDALLDDGVPVNVRNANGDTAMHFAVRHRDPELIRRLVTAGAKANLAGSKGKRPLHLLFRGRVDGGTSVILRELVAAGADVNAADDHGMTILCLALAHHDQRAARRAAEMLLRHGAELRPRSGCAPVVQVLDADLLRRMVELGADVNARPKFDTLEDKYGSYEASALWQAAYSGNVQRAELLLELGADIEQRDNRFGLTPLQATLAGQNYKKDKGRPMLRLLMDHGADRSAIAWDGRTLEDVDQNGSLEDLLVSR